MLNKVSIPDVTAMANALHILILITPGNILAPPTLAASPPKNASDIIAEPAVAGNISDTGVKKTTKRGNAAPALKLIADVMAA